MLRIYDDKRSSYFSNARVQIEPLLRKRTARVLEIGCGTGATTRWLRATGRIDSAWGMELMPAAANEARAHFQDVVVGDAEVLISSAYSGMMFDLMLCLDVLEHMVDPWQFLKTATTLLAPGGQLIISVPNIRCARVLLPLLLRGQWNYAEDGILDRTHLRFFTRDTAIALATSSGLNADRCIGLPKPNTRLAKVDRWTFGRLSEFTSLQYLVSATAPC